MISTIINTDYSIRVHNATDTNPTNSLNLYTKFSTHVNATWEMIWDVLMYKVQNPHLYIPHVIENFKILERYEDGILHEIKTPGIHIKERVTAAKQAGKLTFTVVEHPLFSGQIINQVTAPSNDNPTSWPRLTYTVDFKPNSDRALEQAEAWWFIKTAQPEVIKHAVHHIKNIIENKTKKGSFKP